MSATFWNMRRRKAAQKQNTPAKGAEKKAATSPKKQNAPAKGAEMEVKSVVEPSEEKMEALGEP